MKQKPDADLFFDCTHFTIQGRRDSAIRFVVRDVECRPNSIFVRICLFNPAVYIPTRECGHHFNHLVLALVHQGLFIGNLSCFFSFKIACTVIYFYLVAHGVGCQGRIHHAPDREQAPELSYRLQANDLVFPINAEHDHICAHSTLHPAPLCS